MPVSMDNLDKRLRTMEAAASELKGVRKMVKWAAGFIIALVLATVGNFLWAFFDVRASVLIHNRDITHLEKSLQEKSKDLEKLTHDHNVLRRNVVILWERSGKAFPAMAEALVYDGQILSVSDKELVLLPNDTSQPAIRFPLPENVPVRFKKQPAQLADLKAGMQVEVETAGGRIEVIVFKTPSPE